MIVFSLKCARNHEFEAWFRDGASYESQRAKRAVACPECGSTKVAKAPMAPRLSKGRGEPDESAKQTAVMARNALEALRRRIEDNCDYVGERFPEEARKIHYGEVEQRDIYGEASDEEARSLIDEGVEFHRVPWIRRTNG